jgi:surface polysaccharide O-acyltransferase-like enzyme
VSAATPQYIWLTALTGTLFHGSTLYFALISGILFTRVLRTRSRTAFYKSKLTHVLLPYVLLSVLMTLLGWPPGPDYGMASGLTSQFPGVLARNLMTGGAQTHLWYIPVLMALFLLTPLLDALLKHGKGVGVILLALMPLIVSRSVYPNLLSLESICFFLGAYAFGMFLGERLEGMLTFVKRHLSALLILLLAFTALNFLLFRWDYVASGFTSLHQSVVYCQKMLEAVLILYGLHVREDRLPKLLGLLGTHAFSLYFLHITFIWALSHALISIAPITGIGRVIVYSLAIYALSILFSLLLSMAVRRLAGRYSRMLIGS